MKIQSEIEIKDLTPEHLSEGFWNLVDKDQARFFEHLGNLALATTSPFSKQVGSYFGLDMQMCYAQDHCSGNALRVMEIIGQINSPERLQPYLTSKQTMPVIHGKEAA